MPLSRGQRLRRLRAAKGVEQKEAAAAIEISAPWLSLLERDQGKNLNHIRGTLERAAAYYGVIPEYLLVDTPQEYMAAYVQKLQGEGAAPTTLGGRIRIVLEELYRRWGDEFSEASLATTLGTEVETLRGYKEDRVPVPDVNFIHHLADVTGVPVDFLLPRPPIGEDDPAIKRVVALAVQNGIPAEELERLIQAWVLARLQTKKPSVG